MVTLQKELVKKTYYVHLQPYTADTVKTWTFQEMGLNIDKLIIPPMVETFNSVASSDAFLFRLSTKYNTQLEFVSNVSQTTLAFTVVWYELQD